MPSLWTAIANTRLPRLAFGLHSMALRLRPPLTLGVRAMVLDDRDFVLLVRHTYRDGWYLPGGGVDRWETLAEAAARETREEACVVVEALGDPFGVYAHFIPEKSDHVALFVTRDWRHDGALRRSPEIADSGFFPADALPDGTTEATHRRLAEVLGGADRSPRW
ncbi:MAG: NUDIX domain-containing protein [Inquilinaceae bacterium]